MSRERVETIEAIHEGLADVEAGRTYPVEQVVQELRERLESPEHAS